MIKKLAAVTVSALVLGLAMGALGRSTADAGVSVLFGWLSFAVRVLPRVTVSWPGVATAVVCLVLFAGGLHAFLRWIHGELRGEGAGRWRARWTGAIVAGVVVMFVAGLAATGIAHQGGWLLRSRGTWLAPRVHINSFADSVPSGSRLLATGIAVAGYASSRDHVPLGRFDDRGRALHSWMTAILPYLPATAGGIDRDVPWDDPANSAYFRGIVPQYLNPEVGAIRDARGYALSHYAGNVHVVGRRRPLELGDVTNGAAQTIVAGEAPDAFKAWGDPANLRDPIRGINRGSDGFGSPSGDGATLLFLDGSVRHLGGKTSPQVLRRLSLPFRRTESPPAT